MWHLHMCAHPYKDLCVISASFSIEEFIDSPPKVRNWGVKHNILNLSAQEITFIAITIIVVVITRERRKP